MFSKVLLLRLLIVAVTVPLGAWYSSIFDLTSRIDLRAANRKALESLALAGGFDSFKGVHRAQYFALDGNATFLEKAIKYGNALQGGQETNQVSMFGEGTGVEIPEPKVPSAEEWGSLEKLSKEKELVGIYISGHPLDDFKIEIKNFTFGNVEATNNLERHRNKELKLAGIITLAEHRVSRKGNPFGKFEFEDHSGSGEFLLFGEDYLKMKHFLVTGNLLYLQGRVQKRRYGDELEFSIHKMDLLSDVREKMANGLIVDIAAREVSDTLIQQLDDIISSHEGKFQLKFSVYDPLEKLRVNLPSRTRKISIDDALIKELESIESVSCTLF